MFSIKNPVFEELFRRTKLIWISYIKGERVYDPDLTLLFYYFWIRVFKGSLYTGYTKVRKNIRIKNFWIN